MKRTVAALCVSGRSIYKHLPGVVAYDRQRDARTFQGGMPVIAHPPCRCWSKYLGQFAEPENRRAEVDLGLWCIEQVLHWGGVLEQPAESYLFHVGGLPLPDQSRNPLLYTLYLEQRWFGYATKKPTWVLVVGVPKHRLPPWNFSLPQADYDFGLSSAGNSRSMPAFASWLYRVAASTCFSLPVRSWTDAKAIEERAHAISPADSAMPKAAPAVPVPIRTWVLPDAKSQVLRAMCQV